MVSTRMRTGQGGRFMRTNLTSWSEAGGAAWSVAGPGAPAVQGGSACSGRCVPSSSSASAAQGRSLCLLSRVLHDGCHWAEDPRPGDFPEPCICEDPVSMELCTPVSGTEVWVCPPREATARSDVLSPGGWSSHGHRCLGCVTATCSSDTLHGESIAPVGEWGGAQALAARSTGFSGRALVLPVGTEPK